MIRLSLPMATEAGLNDDTRSSHALLPHTSIRSSDNLTANRLQHNCCLFLLSVLTPHLASTMSSLDTYRGRVGLFLPFASSKAAQEAPSPSLKDLCSLNCDAIPSLLSDTSIDGLNLLTCRDERVPQIAAPVTSLCGSS